MRDEAGFKHSPKKSPIFCLRGGQPRRFLTASRTDPARYGMPAMDGAAASQRKFVRRRKKPNLKGLTASKVFDLIKTGDKPRVNTIVATSSLRRLLQQGGEATLTITVSRDGWQAFVVASGRRKKTACHPQRVGHAVQVMSACSDAK